MPEEKTTTLAFYREPLVFELEETKYERYSPPNIPNEIEKSIKKPMALIPKEMQRTEPPNLPKLAEFQLARHYLHLAQMNFTVDSGFYPLGSCTMKYNPKINDYISTDKRVAMAHPFQPARTVQGNLRILYETEQMLNELAGMARTTLQPSAGAHGELTGIMVIRAYHIDKGEGETRNEVIVPDSAHGTNPATAAMAGYKTVIIKSKENGLVDLEALKAAVSEKTAALMLTNPNTLGLFEEEIVEIAKIVHDVGGLLYYDGANFNAIMGICRPGDMGFDAIHFNLHKTFGTPHGGGGPGSGPVGVVEKLVPYLPKPLPEFNKKTGTYYLKFDMPKSIGKIKGFWGNYSVIVRAYAYMLSLGADGLKRVSEQAVLNSNYLKKKLLDLGGWELPFAPEVPRKHEFVLDGENLKKETGVSTLDVAKRLLDLGYHAPTVYFPLIVHEALMIEPTETETKQTLDDFTDAMKQILKESKENPEIVLSAPQKTPVGRIDEVLAAKEPILTWQMLQQKEEEK
ncbi:MAG: aminomethyl-transferring glycine dehydrogenase subunit GcvPB [Candidatus Heimdallarchaeota archaeon]|nr:aminomethyl-transferring glycine dehydrogenase subunit GcvPB [Candidatus Heimdallarchaeota archaeon]MBY8994274.1 aminomethyl-transferring glycine dehydrogenase subunit GcvPB [Candidatus Heimdallarchaeota archaeon]